MEFKNFDDAGQVVVEILNNMVINEKSVAVEFVSQEANENKKEAAEECKSIHIRSS